MTIGLIHVGYKCADTLRDSLRPWLAAKEQSLGGHRFVICAVSVPFESFDSSALPNDDTRSILGELAHSGQIDHAIVRDKPMKETEARGAALQWLVGQGAEAIHQVDSDEYYDVGQIERIYRFIDARPQVTWFRVALKNQVFTPSQHLAEPFTPPRIHRVNVPGYRAHSFWDDNNVLYGGTITRDLIRDVEFASVTVPRQIAWVPHASWLNSLRSKVKQAYQWSRWGNCTFAWDDRRGGLIFRDGVPPPEVARDAE